MYPINGCMLKSTCDWRPGFREGSCRVYKVQGPRLESRIAGGRNVWYLIDQRMNEWKLFTGSSDKKDCDA